MFFNQDDVQPIALELGAAVLDSQRLEYALSFLMLLLGKEVGVSHPNDAINDFMGELSKKTLGNLILRLEKKYSFEARLVDEMKEALEHRNYIIHGFLNDRAESLASPTGRQEALADLKFRRKKLQQCHTLVDKTVQLIAEHNDMPLDEFRKQVFENYVPGSQTEIPSNH
jgi:hypothetical protein